MAKVLTGISGNLISAASAGFAPTNSADVSAIASAYQVVSATATQLYAGTAYVTSVNSAPLSASRAGNAANASLASSAWYDGTGRLISALPDSAAVSAIASAYAESAASGKQDELTFSYDDDKISAINGSALAGQGGGGGGSVASPSGTIIVTDGTAIEATNSAIGSSTVEQKLLNLAPSSPQINYWYSNVLMGGQSVSGASLMKLQALENTYNPTTVFTVSISGNPIGGGSEIVGTATASSYGSSMEFDFPLDPSWGFGTIWGSANPNTINLDTADANAIAFYSTSTASGVKELAWKEDIPTPINIGVYENIYHDKYVSSIDNIPVSAKWAGSANYTYTASTAEQDPNGRYLSSLASKTSIPTGVTSPNGTIIANGFNVEATNSAVTTTVVPGYATTVVGISGQLGPDYPVVCTLPSANENSKLFFQLDYGGTITASAVYNGTTATASAGAGPVEVVLDVPNATTVSLYGSWYRNMSGSASASAADYLAPGSIGELAWASALPTYSYDAEDKISAINGSALAGTTYSAGTGIDITNDEISVNYDTDTLSTVSGTATANVTEMDGEGFCTLPAGVQAVAVTGSSPSTVLIHIPGNTLYFGGDKSSHTFRVMLGAANYDPMIEEGDYTQYTSVAVSCTYDNKRYTYVDEQDIEITLPCNSQNGWMYSLVPTKFTIGIDIDDDGGDPYADVVLNSRGSVFSGEGIVFTYRDVANQKLAVKNPVPSSTSAEEGKCLVVDSNGVPEWGTGGKTYTGTDGVVVDNVNDTVGLEAPVDIVAGPGIVIDNPDGNTLRVSTDENYETVLWSGEALTGITLSESLTNFEQIKVVYSEGAGSTRIGYFVTNHFDDTHLAGVGSGYYWEDTSDYPMHIHGINLSISSNAVTVVTALAQCFSITNNAFVKWDIGSSFRLLKVVGIHRIANN